MLQNGPYTPNIINIAISQQKSLFGFQSRSLEAAFGLHRKSGTTDFDAEKKLSVKGRLEGKKSSHFQSHAAICHRENADLGYPVFRLVTCIERGNQSFGDRKQQKPLIIVMDIKPITIRLVMKLVGGGFFALTFPTIILGLRTKQLMCPKRCFPIHISSLSCCFQMTRRFKRI